MEEQFLQWVRQLPSSDGHRAGAVLGGSGSNVELGIGDRLARARHDVGGLFGMAGGQRSRIHRALPRCR